MRSRLPRARRRASWKAQGLTRGWLAGAPQSSRWEVWPLLGSISPETVIDCPSLNNGFLAIFDLNAGPIGRR
jgi:hypothetical protein